MKKLIITLGLVFGVACNANAYIECTVNLASIYAGDDGAIWATTSEGIAFVILKDDPNIKNSLTLMTAALMGGNKVSVRFKNDNQQCSGTKYDFSGIWLLKK